jgi:hypothetical protein
MNLNQKKFKIDDNAHLKNQQNLEIPLLTTPRTAGFIPT